MPVQASIELGNLSRGESCAPIEEPSSAPVSALIHDLADTLRDFRERNGFGRGIAAPQIGVMRRLVYIDMGRNLFSGAMLNPRITSESGDRYEMWDGCFSFPEIVVRVSRAREVRVDYEDENGAPLSLEAEGELSALIQHELDHLDGILAVQRAVSPKAFMTRREWERQGRPL